MNAAQSPARAAMVARGLALGFTSATLVLSACNKRQHEPTTAQLNAQPPNAHTGPTSTTVEQDVPSLPVTVTATAPSTGARCDAAGASWSRLIGDTLHSCFCSDDERGDQRWTCNEHGLLADPLNQTACSAVGESRAASQSAGGRCECVETDRDERRWACRLMFHVGVGPMPPPELAAFSAQPELSA